MTAFFPPGKSSPPNLARFGDFPLLLSPSSEHSPVAQVPPSVCPAVEPMLQMWSEQIREQWVSALPLFITVYSYQALLFSDFLVYFRHSISVSLNVALLSVPLKFLRIFLEVCSH